MSAERNPQQTRKKILAAALDEIHAHGYQGTRIDKVLEKTQLAKGALYHHFPTKQELGYAVTDELLKAYIEDLWVAGLKKEGDPLTNLQAILKYYLKEYGAAVVRNGCPLINLSQEMPGLDQGFRERLFAIYEIWIGAIKSALKQGQARGQVKPDLNAEVIAKFIVSSFVGLTVTVKCSQSLDNFEKLTGALVDYVESLR